MGRLELWQFYSRKEVHDIFSPDTTFTPQSGTWGLQGIVKVPFRPGDYVFFVTFGKSQGEHVFDESITEDGVLSWQSQPSQNFSSKDIIAFINHDERINNIHLFLSTRGQDKYGYFGKLGYLTHDRQREKPVYFQWQLMDWAPPVGFLDAVDLGLLSSTTLPAISPEQPPQNSLIFTEPPKAGGQRSGTSTAQFRTRKAPNYGAQQERNAALGLRGELLVLQKEIEALNEAGLQALAAKVVHVSVQEGDGSGYDIRSFSNDGTIRYIEVKTTKGPASSSFFISSTEVEFSRQNEASFFLYRLYDFDDLANTAKAYVLSGDISQAVNLVPTEFRATPRKKDDE